LFSSYRLDQYNDPDSFVKQVAIIFAGYEDAVLIRTTDPSRRDCIQRTYKFPPSLQEISEALDDAKKTIAALAHVEERTSRGFSYVSGRGFINAAGEKYNAVKHRTLPQITFPVAPAD
jgi:chromosome condensin MukBEF ATPase and DNA-binding subunit MukB